MASPWNALRSTDLGARFRWAVTTIGSAVIALMSLALWVWVVILSVRDPTIGFVWSSFDRGRVLAVAAAGPVDGLLQPGSDRILSVNGLARPTFPLPADQRRRGATLTLEVADMGGQTRLVTTTVPSQIRPPVLVERSVLLFVDLVFWICSLSVIPIAERFDIGRRTILMFFATLQLVVFYTLLTLVGCHLGETWTGLATASALWLSVIAVHLHLRFPMPRRLPVVGRWALIGAYVAAGLLSLNRLLGPTAEVRFLAWGIQLHFILVALGLLLVIGFANLLAKSTGLTRFRIRLISLAAFVGLAPMLLLTALPYVVSPNPASQLTTTSLFMSLVPIGYTYAILRYQLTRSDDVLSRALGYVMAILVMAVVMLSGLGALVTLGAELNVTHFLAVTIVLALGFEPLRRRSQRLVERLLYQPWEEYRATLRSVDAPLGSAFDVSTWARVLCAQFAQTLAVRPVGLLYRPPHGNAFQLAEHGLAADAPHLDEALAAASPVISALVAAPAPLATRDLRATLAGHALPGSARAWLADAPYDLWWPIASRGGLQAVLLFGSRSNAFTPDEVELIALSARQIGVALENAQFARELEHLSRSALQTRDEERRRVSRELHDHIIQPLVGLNFALSAAREAPAAAEARLQVADLITQVRRISADLRPPALDEVGLAAAARGLARTFARMTGVQVEFGVDPDDDLEVPEPLASTFFGALREALNNIRSHAQATRVSIQLTALGGGLSLVVQDDGIGFTLPARLGQLALAGHFGLLGLQERLAALGGVLELITQPGHGTRLSCRAPFPGAGHMPDDVLLPGR